MKRLRILGVLDDFKMESSMALSLTQETLDSRIALYIPV